MIRRIVLSLAIIALFSATLFAAPKPDDLVFFVNKGSVGITELKLKELEQIFLSKMTEWSDKKSGAIVPYNLALDTPERIGFRKELKVRKIRLTAKNQR